MPAQLSAVANLYPKHYIGTVPPVRGTNHVIAIMYS